MQIEISYLQELAEFRF